jgi:hypothetical protein
MNTSKSGRIGAVLRRSFLTIASTAAGLIASQNAGAALDGAAAYNAPYYIPSFVTDVRALIADSARRHTWQVIDERPGEMTLRLNHVKAHMTVVARARYTKSELWFERVSANTYQCVPDQPCQVAPEVVHRWMVTLRREVGVSLLRMAIVDAGGSLPR